MLRFICFWLCFVWAILPTHAQIINDQETQQIASEALQKTYLGEYRQARILTETIGEKYPKHPVFSFLKAYIITWESFPLTKQSEDYSIFENHLQNCVSRSLAMLDKNKESTEGIFFAMMGYSLLAMYEAENGGFMSSVSYGRKAFSYMKKGFTLGAVLPDFYFSTGLYKYYAIQYPETHPIAKPFMTFFPEGNKQEGLQNLVKASQMGRFSQVEALLYLNSIYAKYEQNPYLALDYTYKLVNLYPNHSFFWLKYTEHLVALGRYAEAELHFAKFNTRTERVYIIGSQTLKGLVQEKYYKNTTEAKLAYEKATRYETYDMRYSKDYIAFSYAGLARIAIQQGDLKLAKDYYKKVEDLSEYESLKREAKTFLRN
jgi:hypothetical protein